MRILGYAGGAAVIPNHIRRAEIMAFWYEKGDYFRFSVLKYFSCAMFLNLLY